MACAEIDEATRTWCIPASRAKNDKAHLVHLSKPVWTIVRQTDIGKKALPGIHAGQARIGSAFRRQWLVAP
jgi:hypothetical protein